MKTFVVSPGAAAGKGGAERERERGGGMGGMGRVPPAPGRGEKKTMYTQTRGILKNTGEGGGGGVKERRHHGGGRSKGVLRYVTVPPRVDPAGSLGSERTEPAPFRLATR